MPPIGPVHGPPRGPRPKGCGCGCLPGCLTFMVSIVLGAIGLLMLIF